MSVGLINTALISQRYSSLIHADSHGASGSMLGLGAVYYGFCHAMQSQISVCIGSGAGFVPGLLRQAQIDARLEPSITYLIDANLPDLGFGGPALHGGWMTPNNDFLSWAEGVVPLRMLSRDAATLFARHALSIDYLHIDGDHSKSGVLADLQNYIPLTSSGAIVSLHDYNLKTVQEAVSEFLSVNPGWELFSFNDIGTGCCFLRKCSQGQSVARCYRSEIPAAMLPPAIYQQAMNEDDEPLDVSAQFDRWPYLKSPGFKLRYEIAARFVDSEAVSLVEIGGFPNSIVGYLNKCRQVFAVEPYLPKWHETSVHDEAATRDISLIFFKGTAGNSSLNRKALGRFNLVMLGFDLSEAVTNEEQAYDDLSALADLIVQAETTVVELPQYEASQVAWACLEKALRPDKVHEIVLDLREDPSAIDFLVTDGRAVRRLMVITGCKPLEQVDVEQTLKQGALELIKLKPLHLINQEPVYTIGDVIEFGKDGNCSKYLRNGWSYLEDGLVWCQGLLSRLEMEIVNREELNPEGTYLICARVWPAGELELHPQQHLKVVINGEKLFEQSLGLERHDLKIPISGQVLLKNEKVEFVFEHPDAIQPCRLYPASNQDQRMLAFAFEELLIVQAFSTSEDKQG